MGGKASRDRGHRFERRMAEEFRNIGYTDCITSRAGDKSMDEQGVDLLKTYPFNIQCKNYKQCVNYPQIFSEMPDDTNYNVILSKVKRKGTYAILTLDDFLELIQKLKKEQII